MQRARVRGAASASRRSADRPAGAPPDLASAGAAALTPMLTARVRRRWLVAAPRLLMPALAVALLLAGCGDGSSGGPPAGPVEAADTPTVSPAGPPTVQLPDGFPPQLPDPSPGAAITSTEVVEQALQGQDLSEHGTVVHRTVHYRSPAGGDGGQQVLQHYRGELPEAGWRITSDAPVEQQRAASPTPGHRLRVEGHGHGDVSITVEPAAEAAVTWLVSVTEADPQRRPYSRHPPSIQLPGWYAHLPEPPEHVRRFAVRVTTTTDGASYVVEYTDTYDGGDLLGRAGDLADHYRHSLAASGWRVLDGQDTTEQRDVDSGTVTERTVTVSFGGHEVHEATVAATQSTDITGTWGPARLSIRVEDG